MLVHILSQKIYVLEIMLINLKLKAEEAGKSEFIRRCWITVQNYFDV